MDALIGVVSSFFDDLLGAKCLTIFWADHQHQVLLTCSAGKLRIIEELPLGEGLALGMAPRTALLGSSCPVAIIFAFQIGLCICRASTDGQAGHNVLQCRCAWL